MQLSKYANGLARRYPKAETKLVLLTIAGYTPHSINKYRKTRTEALTYEALLRVLLPVFRKHDQSDRDGYTPNFEFARLLFADIARLCNVHVGDRRSEDIFQLEALIKAQLL